MASLWTFQFLCGKAKSLGHFCFAKNGMPVPGAPIGLVALRLVGCAAHLPGHHLTRSIRGVVLPLAAEAKPLAGQKAPWIDFRRRKWGEVIELSTREKKVGGGFLG